MWRTEKTKASKTRINLKACQPQALIWEPEPEPMEPTERANDRDPKKERSKFKQKRALSLFSLSLPISVSVSQWMLLTCSFSCNMFVAVVRLLKIEIGRTLRCYTGSEWKRGEERSEAETERDKTGAGKTNQSMRCFAFCFYWFDTSIYTLTDTLGMTEVWSNMQQFENG